MLILGTSSIVKETECQTFGGRDREPPTLIVIVFSDLSLVNLMAFVLAGY
jgi:hypothetical protein